MYFKVAICAEKGFRDRALRDADNDTKALVLEAEMYEHGGKEILFWPWTKWREESPEVKHIMENLPSVYDLLIIDEEGNVYEGIDGVGVLSAETIVTWSGQDRDIQQANRENFLRKLKSFGINSDLADQIAQAAEEVYV